MWHFTFIPRLLRSFYGTSNLLIECVLSYRIRVLYVTSSIYLAYMTWFIHSSPPDLLRSPFGFVDRMYIRHRQTKGWRQKLRARKHTLTHMYMHTHSLSHIHTHTHTHRKTLDGLWCRDCRSAHDSFMYVWHDSCICVTWLIHTCGLSLSAHTWQSINWIVA